MHTTAPVEVRARDLTNALIWHTAASIGLDAMAGTVDPEVTGLVELLTRHGFRFALIRALQMQATGLTEPEAEAERVTFAAHENAANRGLSA